VAGTDEAKNFDKMAGNIVEEHSFGRPRMSQFEMLLAVMNYCISGRSRIIEIGSI
jgi:hypothetical protein